MIFKDALIIILSFNDWYNNKELKKFEQKHITNRKMITL